MMRTYISCDSTLPTTSLNALTEQSYPCLHQLDACSEGRSLSSVLEDVESAEPVAW